MGKTITLYEMATDLINLIEVEEVNEEIKEELIEQIKLNMETKAENIISAIRNYEASINAIKEEEKRLAEYRRIKENQLSRLKEYTQNVMELMEYKKLDTSLGRISLRKKPLSLEIVDEKLIPSEYKEEIVSLKIDKVQIKKDLKVKEIQGVKLVEGGNSLVIK